MLKQMREGAKSTVLKLALFGLLLLAMAGLAIMDVQGMFRGGVGGNTVAKIDGDKMSVIVFDRMVQNTLHEQRIKQSDAYRTGLPLQILKQEIDGRLFALAARDMGIQVGDDLAAKKLKELLAPIVAKGLTEKQALQRVLETYNMDEARLVGTMKSQIALQQLLGMVTSGARPPQQLISDTLQYRNEWRRGQYFTISTDALTGLADPSDTELRAYYDAITKEYALPEYRSLSVLMLDAKSLGEDARVSEEKLKQYYEENISDFSTLETRMISQAVAPDEATAKAMIAEAEKTHDLQKAAMKGAYIKPSAVTEAEMPAELAKIAFSTPAGKLAAPIQSPLGWHVLYVEKVIPGSAKPFSAVKASIEKELAQDEVSEALYQHANKIDDEIAGGKTLAEVAQENSLKLTKLDSLNDHGVNRSGKKYDGSLPLFDKIVETGFALAKGAASQLIETPDGAFMIVSTDEVYPSEQQPFEKVKTEVLARWKLGNQAKALSEKSAALLGRLAKGESFDKIAAEFGKSVQSTPFLKRGTPAASVKLEDTLVQSLFSIEKSGGVTTVGGNKNITLVRLAERKLKPLKEISKDDATAAETALNQAFQQDLLEQFRLSLMDKYNVSINEKLINDMYHPKDENAAEE